ncbi:MAG: matrixin family metalloprotease [Gemmatimonadota bacterium]
MLVVIVSCIAPDSARSQSVVGPTAAYVEAPTGPIPATTARWRVDGHEPRTIRVAFGPAPDGEDGAEFWSAARHAIDDWSAVPDLPVRFELVRTTDDPDVEFRWIDRFPVSQAGATHRRLADDGFIDHVTVVLARLHTDGTRMGREFRLLVALHEVGHVLGLPHSEHPGDVMHPGNRNLEISARDLRSLRILYEEAGAAR